MVNHTDPNQLKLFLYTSGITPEVINNCNYCYINAMNVYISLLIAGQREYYIIMQPHLQNRI